MVVIRRTSPHPSTKLVDLHKYHHWTNVLRALGRELLRTLEPRADTLVTLMLHFDYFIASPLPKIPSGSDKRVVRGSTVRCFVRLAHVYVV